jgi:predicted DNA-binding transcriptional regulator AlpA
MEQQTKTWMSMPEAARATGVHRVTLWRWMKHGYRIGDRVVRLAGRSVGRRTETTADALEQFFRAIHVERADIPIEQPQAPPSDAALAAAGW